MVFQIRTLIRPAVLQGMMMSLKVKEKKKFTRKFAIFIPIQSLSCLYIRSDEEEGQINPQNDGEELLLQSLCSATPSTQKYITKYVDDDLSAFLTKSAENRILDKSASASQVSRTIKAATRHIDALKKAPIPKDGLRHFSSPPSPRNILENNPSSTVPSIIESQVKELNRDEILPG